MAEPRGGSPPLVIKAGGSLAETGRLSKALELIERAARPVVVVPGGGPFADTVRSLQPGMGYDEATAHRLAMLGMHLMAEVFLSRAARFQIAPTLAAIDAALAAGKVAIWVPLPMMDDDSLIDRGWGTTSDSLAARLAEILGSPLVLLKSVSVDGSASAEQLSRDGVVDAAFPGIVARSRIDWRIFGPEDGAALAEALSAS